jgi:hypothetical protein
VIVRASAVQMKHPGRRLHNCAAGEAKGEAYSLERFSRVWNRMGFPRAV